MSHETAERLQKALARLGLASRREAEEWIRAGRLTVNGNVATLGVRVQESDQVRLDGRLVRRRMPDSAQVFVCHRSPGDDLKPPQAAPGDESGVDAPAEASERTSVQERLPTRAGRRFMSVSPMPRIDGGLELVTSDGELALKLQRFVKKLGMEFSVRVRGELDEAQIARVQEGMLDRGTSIKVEAFEASGGEATNRWYVITTRGASGKDIRQLFERQGAIVSRVLRTRLGPLQLERKLARGQFRKLGTPELDALMSLTGEKPAAPLAQSDSSAARRLSAPKAGSRSLNRRSAKNAGNSRRRG